MIDFLSETERLLEPFAQAHTYFGASCITQSPPRSDEGACDERVGLIKGLGKDVGKK